jgi:RNA polymerase sigma factor (sigma-70 family)
MNGRINAVRDLQTLFEVGSLGGLSDGQLLNHFIERREEAVFEAILLRHGPMVWGVCRRVLRDHHDAEDAFQAKFLVLARKASSVMPREMLCNWLYGVAHQTAMTARAVRAKRRMRESQVLDMPEPAMVPNGLRDELAESLDRELSRLPEKYRIPIVLCELEGSLRSGPNHLCLQQRGEAVERPRVTQEGSGATEHERYEFGLRRRRLRRPDLRVQQQNRRVEAHGFTCPKMREEHFTLRHEGRAACPLAQGIPTLDLPPMGAHTTRPLCRG